MSVVLLVIGLLLFVGLVVVHEFGHFLAARRNGVEVEEFGIGFPPRAWKRKTKSGYLFTLNWLPIGGFVKLKGENDSATEKGSFGAASFKTKSKIMLAGVAMNLLVAFVMFTLLALAGMPRLIDNQFTVAGDSRIVRTRVLATYIVPGSPAEKAGLKANDTLLSIMPAGGTTQYFRTAEQLPLITKNLAGKKVAITYARGGETRKLTTTLRSADDAAAHGHSYLGIAPGEFTLTRSTWSAPVVALGLMKQFTVATFQGLGHALAALFHGQGKKASEQVAGPVGIVFVLKNGSALGYQYVLFIIGLLSLSLAIMNLLPIPALDGGRFYMLALSRITGRKLSKAMEERIVGASFVFLLGLIVLITIVDVKRFF